MRLDLAECATGVTKQVTVDTAVLCDLCQGKGTNGNSTPVAVIPKDGLPNYFDDQRFGSVGFSGEFNAHAWLQALRMRLQPLAEPNPFDQQEGGNDSAVINNGRSKLGSRVPRAQHRGLTCGSSHRHRGAFARMRRSCVRSFLGVSEPPVEHDPGPLARRFLATRSDRADLLKSGRSCFSTNGAGDPKCESNLSPLPCSEIGGPRGRLADHPGIARGYRLSGRT